MNVLLDLDGTLTDPRIGIVACLKYAIQSMGQVPPADRELVRFIGPPLQESLASLPGLDNQDKVARTLAFYRERFADVGMYENTVYPGIPEALGRLIDRGATLFVATSKPTVYAERIIEHFGLAQYFRKVYGSELDGARSNKVELVAHALKVESLSASSSVMVGDRAQDVVGAKGNGVFPVGVLWGYGSRDELVKAGAEVLCKQPARLVDAVNRFSY